MRRLFDLVDERDGAIFKRDAAALSMVNSASLPRRNSPSTNSADNALTTAS